MQKEYTGIFTPAGKVVPGFAFGRRIKKLLLLALLLSLGFAVGRAVLKLPLVYLLEVRILRLVPFAAGELARSPEARLVHLTARTRDVNFFLHTVSADEDIWRIAASYGYSIHTIIGCNPQLESYDVFPGQKLLIPSERGTVHQVRCGETWEEIADRYDTSAELLCQVNSGATRLNEGGMIFIPGGMPDTDQLNGRMRAEYGLRTLFVSPLDGQLSSYFGQRKHPVTGEYHFHGGVDIAVDSDTPVRSIADGVIVTAGGDQGHYGVAVAIDHGNGYVSQYGHLSRVAVMPGERVRASQIIARSGASGRVTGPHLHLSILKDGVPEDPLKYLW